MALCTSADVTDRLGTRYDGNTALTAAHVTEYVARAGAWFQGFPGIGGTFTPFNQTGDTPATPGFIREIVATKAWGWCLIQLAGRSGGTQDAEAGEELLARADAMAATLVDNPHAALPREQVSSETLTFGTAAQPWSLPENWAYVGRGSASPVTATVGGVKLPPNILRDSVRILSTSTSSDSGVTGAQLAEMPRGSLWDVVWSERRAAWIFKARASELYGSGAGINLGYEWTYIRRTGETIRTASGFSHEYA